LWPLFWIEFDEADEVITVPKATKKKAAHAVEIDASDDDEMYDDSGLELLESPKAHRIFNFFVKEHYY